MISRRSSGTRVHLPSKPSSLLGSPCPRVSRRTSKQANKQNKQNTVLGKSMHSQKGAREPASHIKNRITSTACVSGIGQGLASTFGRCSPKDRGVGDWAETESQMTLPFERPPPNKLFLLEHRAPPTTWRLRTMQCPPGMLTVGGMGNQPLNQATDKMAALQAHVSGGIQRVEIVVPFLNRQVVNSGLSGLPKARVPKLVYTKSSR